MVFYPTIPTTPTTRKDGVRPHAPRRVRSHAQRRRDHRDHRHRHHPELHGAVQHRQKRRRGGRVRVLSGEGSWLGVGHYEGDGGDIACAGQQRQRDDDARGQGALLQREPQERDEGVRRKDAIPRRRRGGPVRVRGVLLEIEVLRRLLCGPGTYIQSALWTR